MGYKGRAIPVGPAQGFFSRIGLRNMEVEVKQSGQLVPARKVQANEVVAQLVNNFLSRSVDASVAQLYSLLLIETRRRQRSYMALGKHKNRKDL